VLDIFAKNIISTCLASLIMGSFLGVRRRFENMSQNFYQNTITSSLISSILKSFSNKFDAHPSTSPLTFSSKFDV
jgi:hypothetical protein